MKKTTLRLTLILVLALVAPAMARPAQKTITVVGQDDINVDRANIQAALDAVPKNGTVELVGEFQLDGVELFVRNSFTTVRGVALDDDGDGKVNEDWKDGVDNDFDGLIDEDPWNAVLKGILDGDGNPEDGPNAPFFNRGISVAGLDQVQISDLKFTGLVRGVAFTGTFDIGPGGLCSDMFAVPEVRNSSAVRNLFDNQKRGIQVFGGAHNVVMRDNIVINHNAHVPFLLVGKEFGCRNADSSITFVETGTPTLTKIENNRVSDVFQFFTAIWILRADRVQILNNEIRGANTGIFIQGGVQGLVQGNQISDLTGDGVRVSEGVFNTSGADTDSSGLKIQNNLVSNAGGRSFVLENNVHDVKASNNGSVNPGSGEDYLLLASTYDNLVILNPGQTATDLGTNNKIKGS